MSVAMYLVKQFEDLSFDFNVVNREDDLQELNEHLVLDEIDATCGKKGRLYVEDIKRKKLQKQKKEKAGGTRHMLSVEERMKSINNKYLGMFNKML